MCPERARRRGTSLIELMVAICVTSIIVTGAFMVMNEGLQLFRTNKRAADAQVDVLQTLTRINSEVVNARPELVRAYPTEYPATYAGIVFASPLLPDGGVRIDEDTAEMYWQKLVCYYFEPAPGEEFGKIHRAEVLIPPISGETGPGSKDLPNVESLLVTSTTDYFQASTTGVNRRLLGGDISAFQVKLYEGGTGGSTATASIVSHDSYTIIIEAGKRENRSASGYFIKVDSRVTPRG